MVRNFLPALIAFLITVLMAPSAVISAPHLKDFNERDGILRTLGQSSDSGLKASKPGGEAFIKSLLVPGWGQLSQGRRGAATAFITAEALLFGAWLGLRTYADWLEDDYIAMARQHAGVVGSHDHEFYIDIGNWSNEREFNEARIRDRWFDRIYWDLDDRWQWDSEQSRLHFKSVRIASDQARQNAVLFAGGMLLNHLLSAIDAARNQSGGIRVFIRSPEINELAVELRWRGWIKH